MAVDIKSLHIEFPDKVVFEDVTMWVDDGEIVAIETHVLDGGTSLMKGIVGFLNGVDGSVMFEGIDLLDAPPESVAARIGYVYEDRGLVSLYNVFQNISLPLQFHTDLDAGEINRRTADICAQLRIDDELFNLRPHRLNDVQTRLVNLARALVVRPGLLVIDELEGGMPDEILQDTIDILRHHQQEYPMAIIITTSNELIMSNADRVFEIENCRLVERT